MRHLFYADGRLFSQDSFLNCGSIVVGIIDFVEDFESRSVNIYSWRRRQKKAPTRAQQRGIRKGRLFAPIAFQTQIETWETRTGYDTSSVMDG